MNEQALKGLNVLVTRPKHQAEGFCQLIESAVGKAIRFPVIAIEEIQLEQASRDALQHKADALIFISANAVRLGIPAIQRVAPERLTQGKIIAIGQATARQLEEAGYAPDIVPLSPYNSEALLAMPEMQSVQGQRFIIVKGKGGRTWLMEQLRHRGASYSEIDIYVRVKPDTDTSPLDELMQHEQAIVSVTSVKGLHYLFEMANEEQGDWLRTKARFLVPGSRVAEAVKGLHIKQAPWVAENATDAVMFDTLCQALSEVND